MLGKCCKGRKCIVKHNTDLQTFCLLENIVINFILELLLLAYILHGTEPFLKNSFFTASQGNPRILCVPKVRQRMHNFYNLSVKLARLIQFMPLSNFRKSFLILFSHLLFCLASGFITQYYPPNRVPVAPFNPFCYIPRLSHSP
jgi:hypothetical protein